MPSPARSLQVSLAPCPLEKFFKTTESFRKVLQDYQALGQGLWIPRALTKVEGTNPTMSKRETGRMLWYTNWSFVSNLLLLCLVNLFSKCWSLFPSIWQMEMVNGPNHHIAVQGFQGESRGLMSQTVLWGQTRFLTIFIKSNQLITLCQDRSQVFTNSQIRNSFLPLCTLSYYQQFSPIQIRQILGNFVYFPSLLRLLEIKY